MWSGGIRIQDDIFSAKSHMKFGDLGLDIPMYILKAAAGVCGGGFGGSGSTFCTHAVYPKDIPTPGVLCTPDLPSSPPVESQLRIWCRVRGKSAQTQVAQISSVSFDLRSEADPSWPTFG